jgi:glyoxylase-like metal-dependent hydrolase (beta-lactamase superfamily II)
MTTSVHLLAAGYAGDRVASSVTLVRDVDALIVADPGMVAQRRSILDPLAALGVAPEAVTHVFLSHHHPDHTLNVALFPNAEVVDFRARYRADEWLDHDGDGYLLAPSAVLWLMPGHTEKDATLVVRADDAIYALTHLWWRGDRTPEIDPLAWDQAKLEAGRRRLVEAGVEIVIPGHGRSGARTQPPSVRAGAPTPAPRPTGPTPGVRSALPGRARRPPHSTRKDDRRAQAGNRLVRVG